MRIIDGVSRHVDDSRDQLNILTFSMFKNNFEQISISILWGVFQIFSIMQLQAGYKIRQITQILQQRKYKEAINRIEKILQKYEEFQYFALQFHLSLRLLEVRAINKLFQRNLIKKYKYKANIVEYLVELATRNLKYCQDLLKEKIKDQSLFQNNAETLNNFHFTFDTITVNTGTINSNTNSLEDYFYNQKRRRNSIRINNGVITSDKIKNCLSQFFNIFNRTVVLISQTLIIYKKDIQTTLLSKYVQNCSGIQLQTISGRLSQIFMYLFLSKLLFVSQFKSDLLKCQELIEMVIQKLIDIMHQINIVNSKLSKMKDKSPKVQKYEECYRKCQKLMVVSLVLNNKAKMKLGKESTVIASIQIFQSYLQGLPNKYSPFRKLMLPELYLQEQFIKYRTEKSQLIEIITPFFNEKAAYLQELHKERQDKKHSLFEYYNNKHHSLTEHQQERPRTILNELNTVKSLLAITKHKTNQTVPSKMQERSSYDSKNKIITNMIISQIEQINSDYLSQHHLHERPVIKRNPSNSKSIFYKHNSILKKQCQTKKQQKENKDQPLYRQRQLFLKENQYNNFINREKDRLIRRKQEISASLFTPELSLQEEKDNIKENAETFLKVNCKYTEEKSIDIEERDVKRNMVAITSRKKTEIFIQILFQNKQLLGIRKIAEKIQAIRKKESQKAKLLNNRMTSSINRQRQARPSFLKFEVIAKQILRKHISFSNDRPNLSMNLMTQQQTRKKLIQANYTLGQKSIEAVKEKLQRKINKSEITVDKYLKSEQVFKLKLKKLGTTNFILKKSNEEKDQS